MAQLAHETAALQFLAKSPVYEKVKPYSLHHSYDTTLPRNNILVDDVSGIDVHDLRKERESLSFEENGITVLEMHSSLTYGDFDDDQKVQKIYCKEVADALLTYMGGSSVQVFDSRVRIFSSSLDNVDVLIRVVGSDTKTP